MPQWRRTLYTIWFTQFISTVGFSFVVPFMPYYVQELGIKDVAQVGLWAGFVSSATAVSMMFMSPIWGALADRHGRKLMLLRATLAGAVVMSLMGFVTNVQQLVVLRFLQGMFTGTVAAATTLVVSAVPREQSGMALGSLQTATFIGVSLGPLLGGVTGDAFGYRPSFWITGGLLLISGLLVLALVHEEFQPVTDGAEGARRGYGRALTLVLASGPLLAAFAARVLLRAGSRTLDPVLPLFVQSLLPDAAHVATTTGIISGVAALGSALGAPLIGTWGDRLGHRRALIAATLAAGLCYLPQMFVRDAIALTALQLLSGFAVGGTLSTLTALLANLTPKGHEGVVFGLDGSAVAGAQAVGPITGAVVAAQLGLRAPFALAAIMFGIGAAAVLLWIRDTGPQHASPKPAG